MRGAFCADDESMKAQWFIHSNGVVLGPFKTDDVNSRITKKEFGADCLVWAKGSNEWLPMNQWSILSAKADQETKTVVERVWYCDSGTGQPAGPLTQKELVDHLKGINRWDIVTLWGTGLLKWLPLFEVPEVMDLVGISRRENPRAPLLGEIALTQVGSAIAAHVVPALTISVKGFGIKNAGFLQRGEKVQIAIKSRELPATIHATGEVLYVSRSGDAGIKFVDLSPESLALLVDHIRRFTDEIAAA
jgi:hypothetical protein